MTTVNDPDTRTATLRQLALVALRDVDPELSVGMKVQAAAKIRAATRDDPEPPTLREMLNAVEWAIQQEPPPPDPLRELAEWLASKDWMLPALRGIEGAPTELLDEAIVRARLALGQSDG